MTELFRLACITDEFSPDLEEALDAMRDLGMRGAELRVVFGKNIADLTPEDVERARAAVNERGMEVVSLASPLLKCLLPDAPEVDARFQQDVFASQHTFEDQPELTARTFAIAKQAGAPIVRVFSYWRVVEPEAVFDRVVAALRDLAGKAAEEGLIIGLENEAACNIATGAETARVLKALDHPNLKVVWDPANALVAGETPFPYGYDLLPKGRLGHVHAKDCHVEDHKPAWGPLGECAVDWKGQIAALRADGYQGYVSLETHWCGPGGNKHLASMICGRNLKTLVAGPPASGV
jgi:sugar phosphate isomerase/epimerase